MFNGFLIFAKHPILPLYPKGDERGILKIGKNKSIPSPSFKKRKGSFVIRH